MEEELLLRGTGSVDIDTDLGSASTSLDVWLHGIQVNNASGSITINGTNAQSAFNVRTLKTGGGDITVSSDEYMTVTSVTENSGSWNLSEGDAVISSVVEILLLMEL